MDQYQHDYNVNCVNLSKQIREKLLKALGPIKGKRNIDSTDTGDDISQETGPVHRKDVNLFSIFPQGSHASESQIQCKPAKNIGVFKKKGRTKKTAKPVAVPVKAVSFLRYAKTYFSALANLVFKVGTFTVLYGTELIIQVLAMSTIALVMALRFLGIFVRNRYMGSLISYVEKVDFSTLRFPIVSMDLWRLFYGFRHLLWIVSKLCEFFLVIMKHFVIQSIIGIFFLFSWMTYSLGLLVSNFFLRPAVNKTLNILHMDGETLSNVAKLKVDNVLRIIVNLTCNVVPFLSGAVVHFGNMRHNIVKIGLIRDGIMHFLAGVRTFVTTIMELFNDVSAMVRLFLDLHETLLSLVVLFCNSLSFIGYTVYIIFQIMEYVGYVLGVFMHVFTSSSKALSRLQKI